MYNFVCPRPFSWKDDLLPKLKESGLLFETVPYAEWVEKLRNNEKRFGKESWFEIA
jgi:hypothetical protein